jgi:hypothetical protein
MTQKGTIILLDNIEHQKEKSRKMKYMILFAMLFGATEFHALHNTHIFDPETVNAYQTVSWDMELL